jgi:hypothetical protein
MDCASVVLLFFCSSSSEKTKVFLVSCSHSDSRFSHFLAKGDVNPLSSGFLTVLISRSEELGDDPIICIESDVQYIVILSSLSLSLSHFLSSFPDVN